MAGALVEEGRVDLHEELESVVDHSVDRSEGEEGRGSSSVSIRETRLDLARHSYFLDSSTSREQ